MRLMMIFSVVLVKLWANMVTGRSNINTSRWWVISERSKVFMEGECYIEDQHAEYSKV